MKVDRGWNTDFGKDKFSVFVEEDPDLLRLLAERGAADPEKTLAAMTASDIFLALDSEAQFRSAKTHGELFPDESDARRIFWKEARAHRDKRDEILAKYVPVPPAKPVPPQ